jgi:curli biogenesis system outer membrane secretion channel CsgG
MRNFLRFFSIVLIGISTYSFALSYKTVTVTTSATGNSEDKAIVKALGQAIQQANGTQVNVKTHIRDSDQSVVMDWMGNQTVIPSQEINTGYTSSQAGGLIKSYKILSSQYLSSAKTWQVKISAEVAKYANIGKDRSNLLQIAVLPFHTTDASYSTINGNTNADDTALIFNQLLTNDIVNSQQFRVLDRSYWQESNVEEVIVRERSYGTQESIKLGQKLGADYMVVGSINDFDITTVHQKMYGSSTAVYATQFNMQVRVIEVATSDIIWSTNFTHTFDKRRLNRKLQEFKTANPDKTEAQLAIDLQNFIYQSVSLSLSNDIISHITGTPVIENTPISHEVYDEREAKPLTPGSSEAPLTWP